ncbi:MAG: hypothetical protein ACOC44_05350, partial [Promethearchaeia archaeon]
MKDVSLSLKNFEINNIKKDNHIQEIIYITSDGQRTPLLSSFGEYNTLLFFSGRKPLRGQNQKTQLKRVADKNTVKYLYQGNISKKSIKTIDNNTLHFQYTIHSEKKQKYSKIHALYEIVIGKEPDFTWVPHIYLKENHVIADHVFRSPAVIYKKGDLALAFIPDLDLLKNHREFPSFLDFKLKNKFLQDKTTISYGFGKYKPDGHIRFKHKSRYKMKFKASTELIFGYYLKVYSRMDVKGILEDVNGFLWKTYGKAAFSKNLLPQIIPYEENVKEGFKAIFNRHKYWGNFSIDGIPCGGTWQKSWMGKRKKEVKYLSEEEVDPDKHQTSNMNKLVGRDSVLSKIIMYFSNSPFWIKAFDRFTRFFRVIGRVAEIWNNAWFLNQRTGYSFMYFGRYWNDESLIEKGKKTLNTVLALPRIRGVFPSVIAPPEPDADHVNTINGLKAFHYSNDYHLVDTCLTMYWALLFSSDFNHKKKEVIAKSRSLGDLLKDTQLENGAIPTYIRFEEQSQEPIIQETLIDSASSGAALMFLMEYYKTDQDPDVLAACEKIAAFLEREILSQDKWHDFEPFFSCTNLPCDVYDEFTQSHVMNLLCIYWCAEGLKELYKETKNIKYLSMGERTLAIMSLFQQVWDMPYLSYNTFGGFGSQNADAEVSDARQGLFVRTYMEYYLLTGKDEYMERGIATLRACWAMQLLPAYKEISPGNLKGINTVEGVDKGCV